MFDKGDAYTLSEKTFTDVFLAEADAQVTGIDLEGNRQKN